MSTWKRPLGFFILTAAALGAVSILLNRAVPDSRAITLLNILLYLVVMILAYTSGQHAEGTGRSPARAGAAVGAVFAGVSNIALFLKRVTAAQLTVHSPGTTKAPAGLLATINSPATHFSEWAVAVLFIGLLGLVAGYMGGRMTDEPVSPSSPPEESPATSRRSA